MKFKILFLLTSLFLFSSCGSNKKTIDSSTIKDLSTRKIIKNHRKNIFAAKTLNANLKVRSKTNEKSQSISMKLKIEKDKKIWISGSFFGFPVAKAIITPTSVKYYVKPLKKYYEGDFTSLSKLLGAELNFEMLQNLLVGDAIFKPKSSRYTSDINEKSYRLTPKREALLTKIILWVDPLNYKIKKQEIRNTEDNKSLNISYEDYKKIGETFIPQLVKIDGKEGKNKSNIRIEYKSIELNKELSFSYKVPKGYQRIQK